MTEKNIILSYEDDKEGNSYSYVYFKKDLKDNKEGQSKRQVVYDGFDSEEAKNEKLELIVDFDENNKIVGIEIISNRDIIPDVLKK
ncbi:DUF2283 domain-containing protein [Patescibacteria group bacterium]|nr:DUF2283 domain-containing protein [Patescibacteria group bacterium]